MEKENNSNEVTKLRQVREALHMKQKEFAEKLGITQSYLSAVELGKKDITTKLSKRLIELFQVSPEWLMSGFGSIFNSDNLHLIQDGTYTQSEKNGVSGSEIGQNKKYNIRGESDDEALRARRIDALWNQLLGKGDIEMVGYHYAGFSSILGVYSDKVLAYLYEKIDKELTDTLGQIVDGKLDIEDAPSKLKAIVEPMNKMQDVFLKIDQSIHAMMEEVFTRYPDAIDLVKGSPIPIAMFNLRKS